jgi:hypothetical protein
MTIIYTCKFCKTTFETLAQYERHQQRKTACISYKELERQITEKDIIIENYKDHKLKSNKIIQSLKDEEIKNKKIIDAQIQQITKENQKLKVDIEEIMTHYDLLLIQRNQFAEQANLARKETLKLQNDIFLMEIDLKKTWDIQITSPMSSNAKKAMKNILKPFNTIDDVLNIIKNKYDKYKVEKCIYNKIKNLLEIELSISNTSECQICFTNICMNKGLCKMCKFCNTCRACETIQMNSFNKCAFCNTQF